MLILKNGLLRTMAQAPFTGDIALDNGKITAIGQSLSVPGAEEVDVSGCTVMPGLVDAHCHIGVFNDGMNIEGCDGNECTNPLTPELRALDAINPFDRCFEEACAAGVTACVTGPGSGNVVGGQFVAMKTFGSCVEDMLIKAPVAMKAALGENPKTVYTEEKAAPQTRMAMAALLRKAMVNAENYGKKSAEDREKERDLGNEAMLSVLRGELPLKIHAHRADDILTGIRVANEFGVKYTLDHCTEGYLITKQLKEQMGENCLGVIVGPLICERSKIELKNLSMQAPRVLYEAGIEFAMMTDHPVIPLQYLSVSAALAVREGLPEEAALRSITVNAARIGGILDRVGTLELGKDADVAVFSGEPLDFRTRCKLTVINGRIVHSEL